MNSLISTMYDITNENLKKADKNPLSFSEELMQTEVATDIGVLDLSIAKELENRDFLILCYLKLLNRLPEEQVLEAAEKDFLLPKDEFQKGRLKSIVSSEEFSIKQNHVIAANYNIKTGFKTTIDYIPPKFSIRMRDFAYNIYLKMPTSIRKFLKKIKTIFKGAK